MVLLQGLTFYCKNYLNRNNLMTTSLFESMPVVSAMCRERERFVVRTCIATIQDSCFVQGCNVSNTCRQSFLFLKKRTCRTKQNMSNHAAWFYAEPCRAEKRARRQEKHCARQSSIGKGGGLVFCVSLSKLVYLSHHTHRCGSILNVYFLKLSVAMVVCFASSIFHDLFWRLAYVLRENVESIIHAFEPHTPRQKKW